MNKRVHIFLSLFYFKTVYICIFPIFLIIKLGGRYLQEKKNQIQIQSVFIRGTSNVDKDI